MKFCYCIFTTLILVFCSCSRHHPETALQEAESYLVHGEWDNARLCCSSISGTDNPDLSPSQLCRLALAYARLAEACDSPDDMAAAAECFDQAYSLSPDSVLSFAATLDFEQIAQLRMLRDVNMAKSMLPMDEFEEYPDSLYAVSAIDSID